MVFIELIKKNFLLLKMSQLNKSKHVPPVVFTSTEGEFSKPELDAYVLEVIDHVANKWTMCVLEMLEQHGVLRFGQIATLIGEISQRMLTKTLRQMEEDGFVLRTVYAEVPPRVEYALTAAGRDLCAAFCHVWLWAEKYRDQLIKK